jgi:hypothetical protein
MKKYTITDKEWESVLNKVQTLEKENQRLTGVIEGMEKAINYTHCCTELKDKETISFEEWLFVNNYKKLFDYFVKDHIAFTERELMQIYNDQVMSL